MTMKKCLLGLALLLLGNDLSAQPFECVTPGTKLYYEIHNKKGKVTDCQQTTVLGIEERDSCRVIAQLAVYFDKEWNPLTDKNGIVIEPDSTEAIWGKKGINGNISYYIGGRGTPIDRKTVDLLESRGYEYVFRSNGSREYIYSDGMIVGDTLCRYHADDGYRDPGTDESLIMGSTQDAVVYVAAREKVRTPAGTFDCYKIVAEVDSRIKSPMYNPVEQHKFVEWVARGVGAVRLGEEDKKGRLMDYMELVKIEWPGEDVSQTGR